MRYDIARGFAIVVAAAALALAPATGLAHADPDATAAPETTEVVASSEEAPRPVAEVPAELPTAAPAPADVPEAPVVKEPVAPAPPPVAPPEEPKVALPAPASTEAVVQPTVDTPKETRVPSAPPEVKAPASSPAPVAPPVAESSAPASSSSQTPSAEPPVTSSAAPASESSPVSVAPAAPSTSSEQPATADDTSETASSSTASSTVSSEQSTSSETTSSQQSSSAATTSESATSSSNVTSETSSLIQRTAALAKPEVAQAPQADVEAAKVAAVIHQDPAPATKDDIDRQFHDLLNDRHGQTSTSSSTSQTATTTRGRDDHEWDHHVRQWDPRWVQYDGYYRPIFCNPYREVLRVVYIYDNAPRVVYVQPLGRLSIEVRSVGAYSFTAVRVGPGGITVDVTAGNFFGGGYYPGPGLPPPPPPPPVVGYVQVPVIVTYTKVTYRPIRVNRVIDCGYDSKVGSYKVLLDGVTPVWGRWQGQPGNGATFVATATQQFPGLGDPPGEQPLPGNYQLQLASDESSWTDDLGWWIASGLGVILLLVFRKKLLGLFKGSKPQHI